MTGNAKIYKILSISITTLFIVFFAINSPAQPPTLEQVKAAIANGVAWLAAQQHDDGYWGNWERCAITALAVKKLEHHAVDDKWGLGLDSPFSDAYPYKDNVENGLNWLFNNCANTIPISVQPSGDPDTNGNGTGIKWDSGHSSYTSGIALMAVCEAVELDREVENGPLAGLTYEQVARDTMDYLAYGQNDSNWPRGGWGYYENYAGWSDNSNSGWVTLGLGFAETAWPAGCGFDLPQFVKDELNIWIDYIQNDVNGDTHDGGSGYAGPNSWVNILKTGNLLQQMALVDDTPSTARVQDALDYMCRHWGDNNVDPGWRGPSTGVANYQATFTAMKGFTSLGVREIPCEPEPIDWQADFETVLLAQQNSDGSWPETMWDYGIYYGDPPILSTTWALLTLQKVAPPFPVPVDIKPQSCRNPLNVKSKGVLPVAILGTDDFDVNQVDPASVELVGVSPLRWALEDVATPYEPFVGKEDAFDCTDEGPDGYMDLTFKFDIQEIVAALGDVNDGDVLVLSLTGRLMGGEGFVGEDVVVILKKGNG
jgi:hypothetical protein